MRKNSCLALLSCSDNVLCPKLNFPGIIHERKLYNSLGTCTSIFSWDRSVGSAGNGMIGWSDWMACLRINAALNTCCVSSNTPLRLSSSGTPFHRQLFLFFSFLCLVQPQTSLNNWPWLYFTAEHILRFCTLVRLSKTNLMSKCLLIMWLELIKLYPLTFKTQLRWACTLHITIFVFPSLPRSFVVPL